MTELKKEHNALAAFHRGQIVRIRAISVNGRIDALLDSDECVQYRVVYWVNEARKSEWLYAWELVEDQE